VCEDTVYWICEKCRWFLLTARIAEIVAGNMEENL